jgi:tetratricopeptide (TPR) repeat protein
MAAAWQYHQAGDVRRAEELYRRVLQANPSHADAWCFLGAACQAQGNVAEAIACYRRALQLVPGYVTAHNCLGVTLAGQNQFAEAGASFRAALVHEPDNADLHNNLGLALIRQGKLEEALHCIREALRLRPDHAGAHHNLALTLQEQGQLDEAITHFRQALQHQPQFAEAAADLGTALAGQKRWDEAVACFHQALALRPHYPQALYNLGCVLQKLGRTDQAVAAYHQALALNPELVDAHMNLGTVSREQARWHEAEASFRRALYLRPDHVPALQNLAFTLSQQGRLDEALASYRQVLALQPDAADSYYNLALVLKKQGRLEEAIDHLHRALERNPEHVDSHNALGNALKDLDRLDEAMACFERALRLNPKSAEARNNLGVALTILGKRDEALVEYEHSLRLAPDYGEARLNRSMIWLLQGDFRRGWAEYDWRWRSNTLTARSFARPRWDGSPLAGRTILLWAEQGLGDALQFVRYAALVKERGGRVILECPAALVRLLKTCPGVDQVVPERTPLPAFDVQAPLLSLPGILGTTLQNIPTEVPYLFAEQSLVDIWRQKLSSLPGFRVGIVWQGNPRAWDPNLRGADRRRSIPLARFASLADVPGITLVSLQKGFGTEQLTEQASRVSILELGSQLNDFMDTAAVMKNLDLVISADTSPVHLAGALGVPVWIPLPCASCWRWLRERDDSPWYPTARLFRQREVGDWSDVFRRIAAALAEQRSDLPRAAPVAADSLTSPRPSAVALPGSTAEAFATAWKHHQAKEYAQAERIYRQIIAIDPAHADSWCFLGGVYNEQGRSTEAEPCFRRAVELIPGYASAGNFLGILLAQRGDLEGALASFQQVLDSQPDSAEARNNAAQGRKRQGRFHEAVDFYRQGRRVSPEFAEAHWNRSLVWLLCGDFERGWKEYEWRWTQSGFNLRTFPQPRWDGSPLAGRTILVWGEQGLGDVLQFIRYAPLLQQRGGRVLVQCHGPLVSLLRRCRGVHQVVAADDALPDFEVEAPLLSLPGIVGTRLNSIPVSVPYLSADPARVEHWRQRLAAAGPGFRVGIAWQGSLVHRGDRHRSVPLTHFAPLADVAGVQVFSLQVGHGSEQLPTAGFPVFDLGGRFDPASLEDAAAALMNLDLVVTVDTAIAHLAGALGVPVWVALAYTPDWRWLREREDSPWYPTARLFRQRQVGDWSDVFRRIAAALAGKIQEPRAEGGSRLSTLDS